MSDTEEGSAVGEPPNAVQKVIDILIQTINSLKSSIAGAQYKLRSFDGRPRDSQDWWDDFTRFCRIQGLNEEQQKDSLSFHLKGEALTWYRTFSSETKTSIKVLEEAYHDRFNLTEHALHMRLCLLYNEAQEPGQTGCQFSTQVMEKAIVLQISAEKFVDLIIGGLHPSIQHHMVQASPQSVSDLLKLQFMDMRMEQGKAVTK